MTPHIAGLMAWAFVAGVVVGVVLMGLSEARRRRNRTWWRS